MKSYEQKKVANLIGYLMNEWSGSDGNPPQRHLFAVLVDLCELYFNGRTFYAVPDAEDDYCTLADLYDRRTGKTALELYEQPALQQTAQCTFEIHSNTQAKSPQCGICFDEFDLPIGLAIYADLNTFGDLPICDVCARRCVPSLFGQKEKANADNALAIV